MVTGQGGDEVPDQPGVGGGGLDHLLADGEALVGALGAHSPSQPHSQQVITAVLLCRALASGREP